MDSHSEWSILYTVFFPIISPPIISPSSPMARRIAVLLGISCRRVHWLCPRDPQTNIHNQYDIPINIPPNIP